MPPKLLQMLKTEASRQKLQDQFKQLLEQANALIASDSAFVFLFDKAAGDSIFSAHRGDDPSAIDMTNAQAFAWDLAQKSGLFETEKRTVKRSEDTSERHFMRLLGTQISSQGRDSFGALVLASKGRRRWSKRDAESLTFLAKSAAAFLQLKASLHKIRQFEKERRSERAIAVEAEEKFRALAQNVPGAIFRYTRNPDKSEEIEFMSPGCTDIWGYTSQEIEGNPRLLWETVLPDDLEAMKASITQSQEELSFWQHRWRIKNRYGFFKWLQAYGTPYRTKNGGYAWHTLILDVTVEQDAQIALAENSRLLHDAQKLESIGRLAGGVAHDFNNLLAVILGNSEAIDCDRLCPDDAEAVQEIIEASHRGATLVKQLLSFARRSDLRLSHADVQEVLSDVDKLLRRVLPANISLEISQRAGLWRVRLDRGMFESALLNIVINARDAMPQGGAITIETSNVRIDNEYIETRDEDVKPGRYVMVAVTDTGHGIEEGVLPYVFEPFFTTKGSSNDTGLGLAMVQGFVKQSAGAIRIYSEPGHGTAIKMHFPAADEEAGAGKIEKMVAPRPRKKSATVLLVEDQEPVRKVIFKMLVAGGYEVIEARSGDEAIEIYQLHQDKIDVVVTDVVMPGKIQGPQLARLARKINSALPVLYMSGYPHEANVHGNGIRVGDISLMKPVRRADLLTALAKIR